MCLLQALIATTHSNETFRFIETGYLEALQLALFICHAYKTPLDACIIAYGPLF